MWYSLNIWSSNPVLQLEYVRYLTTESYNFITKKHLQKPLQLCPQEGHGDKTDLLRPEEGKGMYPVKQEVNIYRSERRSHLYLLTQSSSHFRLSWSNIFLKKCFCWTEVHFVGPLVPSVSDFGDCSWVSKSGWIHCGLHSFVTCVQWSSFIYGCWDRHRTLITHHWASLARPDPMFWENGYENK